MTPNRGEGSLDVGETRLTRGHSVFRWGRSKVHLHGVDTHGAVYGETG